MIANQEHDIYIYIYMLDDTAITWASQKQACTSDSMTTAKLIALSDSMKETIRLTRLLHSLSISLSLPIMVYCDNQVVHQLIKNVELHWRNKHINVKFLFIREFLTKKLFDFLHVPTIEHIFDIFTKPLPHDAFIKFRSTLGLTQHSEDRVGDSLML